MRRRGGGCLLPAPPQLLLVLLGALLRSRGKRLPRQALPRGSVGGRLPSRARRRRSVPGRRALPGRAAHLPAPAGRGALPCAAPPRFVRAPSRARTRSSRLRRVAAGWSRRSARQAGARGAERLCPGSPRGRCPPRKFGGGGRGLCSRGASGGPGRGGRAGCLAGCRARRVGTAAAPEQECSRAPAATGPLKVQPGSAAAPRATCLASAGTGSPPAAPWHSGARAGVPKIVMRGGFRCAPSEPGGSLIKSRHENFSFVVALSTDMCCFFVLCCGS